MLALTAAGIFGFIGCGHKTDKSKTSAESTEFFKEIGTAEQENAEVTTNMEMPNAAVTTNIFPGASADSSWVFEKPTVQNIQQALKNANIYSGKIDGALGPKTKQAIEAFQAQNNLKTDGKVGPKTWQKLKIYLTAAAPADAATQSPETSSDSNSAKAISD